MTRQLAEDIGGGIICVVAIGGYLAAAPSWWGLGVVAFCLILT